VATKNSAKKSAVVVLKPLAKTVAKTDKKKIIPLEQFSFEQLIAWRDAASKRATARDPQLKLINADAVNLIRILKQGEKKQHSDLLWISKLNKVLRKKAGLK